MNDCGVPCGHEKAVRWDKFVPSTVDGEWSPAAPLYFDGFDGPVLWQLRAPALSLASLVKHRSFAKGGDRVFQACVRTWGVDWPVGSDEIGAVDYVTKWWRACADRADMWWRVEDVTGDTVAEAADRVGYTVDAELAAERIAARRWLGSSTRRPNRGHEAAPLPDWAVELADLSERFGYARSGLPLG